MSLLLPHPPDICARMVVAALWWCVCCGFFNSFSIIIFSFPLARISRILGAAAAFFIYLFFFLTEFMHRLAEGSLEACQGHLAMYSVNYKSEKNVSCWEGVKALLVCTLWRSSAAFITYSALTWHLFTITRCRRGNDELPGLAAHEDRTPQLLITTERTHRVVWAGRDP